MSNSAFDRLLRSGEELTCEIFRQSLVYNIAHYATNAANNAKTKDPSYSEFLPRRHLQTIQNCNREGQQHQVRAYVQPPESDLIFVRVYAVEGVWVCLS